LNDASESDCPRAVKLLPKATSRFARSNLPEVFIEVLSLHRLRSAGVAVELLDFGSDASSFYLVMPRYTHTLRSWRRGVIATGSTVNSVTEADATRPLKHILALYSQAIRAVACMRSLGIEHFDIKADNFLLRHEKSSGAVELGDDAAADDVAAADGLRLVVADLGVARLYDADEAGCSPRDRGTEFIKSPEMLEVIQRSGLQSARGTARGAEAGLGKGAAHGSTIDRGWAVPGACDVWACGCLLYETITGDYLFEQSDWFQFYLRITASSHPLLTPANMSKLPATHADVIAGFLCRVLERDPRKRMHIDEVRQDFARLRLHLVSNPRFS
jgi:serine/threonine protein kinase